MLPTSFDIIATVLFGLAVLHTFSVKRFQHIARKYEAGSIGENFFHLMGEIEIVFGLWAAILVTFAAFLKGGKEAINFVEGRNFTEPAFVFVIMTIAASRPVIQLARSAIRTAARFLPLPRSTSFYIAALIGGPLLGSLITEPAAMTVTALILKSAFFDKQVSSRFKYVSLAVLFVNVSIGGVLTHFAAPPVLMVANTWGWGIDFMFTHFGWKAVIAVVVNTALAVLLLQPELKSKLDPAFLGSEKRLSSPWWLVILHTLFLILVVVTAHHPIFFLGLFLFFIGIARITQEHQDDLKLKESLLVGFFLSGLVILGSPQSWWLRPILENLGAVPLFLGATLLTAFMDNAAITYLGAQVPNISHITQYALVAGAVSGGGLTIIANAPNPAGFAILRESFGPEGISPIVLFIYALVPTLIAMTCFWFLP